MDFGWHGDLGRLDVEGRVECFQLLGCEEVWILRSVFGREGFFPFLKVAEYVRPPVMRFLAESYFVCQSGVSTLSGSNHLQIGLALDTYTQIATLRVYWLDLVFDRRELLVQIAFTHGKFRKSDALIC